MKIKEFNSRKVLIFRHGSLGDTVVALPCFHLIAKAFPDSERRLLTSLPTSDKAVSPSEILNETELIHHSMTYFPKGWNTEKLFRLREEIKKWAPDVLIYLAEPRGSISPWRDTLFFKWCGIKRLIGVPYTKDLRENRWLPAQNSFEHESERLARCLSILGDVCVQDSKNWDLRLTDEEYESASRYLDGWRGKDNFIVSSVTAKVKIKDWGKDNWSRLFNRLSQACPHLGLIVVGGEADAEESAEIIQAWKGPVLNLCGRLTPRQTAAAMKRALIYLSQDSGPMHLAAAMGIPCAAIFVACTKPGVWFPYGEGHKVICPPTNGRGIAHVNVEEVFKEVLSLIQGRLIHQ